MHQYDAIVWTLKLNYSRTRCQNFSGDQGSGSMKLHQERLLLTLKQKFLKFFSWIRHGDSTRWLGMKQNLRSNWYQPLHYPPSPGKVVPHHQGLCPLLFMNSNVGSFKSALTRIRTVKELWDGAYGLPSLSEKTRMSATMAAEDPEC